MKAIKINVLLVSLLLSVAAFPQMGASKADDLKKVQSRTLIVVLEEANGARLVGKLDADQMEAYKKDVEEYNSLIKEVAAKYWKFNAEIEYKTRAEVNALVKAKSTKYAYLEYSKYTVNYAIPLTFKLTQKEKYTDTSEPLCSEYLVSQMNVRLTEDNPNGNPVYGQFLPTPFPTKADLIANLKQIQLQFDYKLKGLGDIKISGLYKDHSKELKGKTLLIWEKNLNMTNDEVKKIYPYPYKIVTKEELDKAIEEGDSTAAFVSIIYASQDSYGYSVYDANSMIEIGHSMKDENTGVKVSGFGITDDLKTLSTISKASGLTHRIAVTKDNVKVFAKQAK